MLAAATFTPVERGFFYTLWGSGYLHISKEEQGIAVGILLLLGVVAHRILTRFDTRCGNREDGIVFCIAGGFVGHSHWQCA